MQDRDKLEMELLELRTVVDAFDGSLRRLAMGDLHQRIDQPLPRGYDALRKDFNRGLASVSATIDTIVTRSQEVRLDVDSVRHSLRHKAADESSRSSQLAVIAADASSAAEDARRQSSHAQHIATILHNARLDMRRPKEAAAHSLERSERTCQSLAHLKGLTDEVRSLLREASLLALNGGITAAHTGAEGQEALEAAKNLHALTRQVGSTIEALSEATETALADANAAFDAGTQVNGEFAAMDVYTEALDAQLNTLCDDSRQHADAMEAIRSDLVELSRRRAPPEEPQSSPELHLGNIDRAINEMERQTSRHTPVRVFTPPPGPAPGPAKRSHLRLVKS